MSMAVCPWFYIFVSVSHNLSMTVAITQFVSIETKEHSESNSSLLRRFRTIDDGDQDSTPPKQNRLIKPKNFSLRRNMSESLEGN